METYLRPDFALGTVSENGVRRGGGGAKLWDVGLILERF